MQVFLISKLIHFNTHFKLPRYLKETKDHDLNLKT